MNELIRMLLDEYANKILFVTQKKPKPACWISEKCGIPIAVCYRRINELEELGLLRMYESRLNQKGKTERKKSEVLHLSVGACNSLQKQKEGRTFNSIN